MVRTFTTDELRTLRLRSQGLSPRGTVATVEAGVEALCGIQAQDPRAAALAIRVRSSGLTASDIRVAQYEDRTIIRTWCMRGTLHLVAVDDLPWLLSLFGPVFVDRAQRRLADFGLDASTCERAMTVIRETLADDEPMTRPELADRIQRAGIECDPTTQAPYHLIRRAALLGIVCEVSPDDTAEERYGLLEDWVSLADPPDRDTALAELARRYLTAYQPATVADFASWSRLPMRDVRRGWNLIEDEIESVVIEGTSMTVLSTTFDDQPTPSEEVLRLLPAYDTYLVGYDTREHALSSADEHRVWPGGGVIRPAVIMGGRVNATWKLDRSRAVDTVVIEPFDGFHSQNFHGLEVEIKDLGRFLRTPIDYRFHDP